MTMRQRLLPLESGFFDTIHRGELYGDLDGDMILLSSNSDTCLFILSRWIGGNRYYFVWMGTSLVVVILCVILLVKVKESSGKRNNSECFLIIFSMCSFSSKFKCSKRKVFFTAVIRFACLVLENVNVGIKP
jgi:hypothetical protein